MTEEEFGTHASTIKFYYVYMVGVYGQGVHFISTSRNKAVSAAQALAADDVDSYHEWQVHCFDPQDPTGTDRRNPLFSITKENVA